MPKRRFLFLQGVCSPFFVRLANHLENEGHSVLKVNFNVGDVAYWWPRASMRFRADLAELRNYFDDVYRRFGITDQVLFGDRRPVHRPAVDHAEVRGVRTHVFEEGYFRPYWVTLEREGVNGHSLLPRDPDWFRASAKRVGRSAPPVTFHSPFWVRATYDVIYHLAGSLNAIAFPEYRTHIPVMAHVAYFGYMTRFARLKLMGRREHKRVTELVTSNRPYFVVPLQLNSDAQIRDHSRFEHMGEVIEYVMESFARHASNDALLVIKNHPLDMGLMDYASIVDACLRRWGLSNRVVYLEDGDLVSLLRHAQGMITVNSTAGTLALELGTPTLCLSDPIYNLPGLTFQGLLDDFWQNRAPPQHELFIDFQRVVMAATQVNGGFYCRPGIELAVKNAGRVLTSDHSLLDALL